MKETADKLSGKTYTPLWVANAILNRIGYTKNIWNKLIVEPSCGDGQILQEIVHRFLKDIIRSTQKYTPELPKTFIKGQLEKCIFGFDIDAEAVALCIKNLDKIAAEYGIENVRWNIHVTDSLLREPLKLWFGRFDFCVGNPPYIRIQHLGEERRKNIQANWTFCKEGAADMYFAFFELGLELLNPNGKLGYITPNTYFKTKAGKLLRAYFKENQIISHIVDFGFSQVFGGRTTYTALTFLDKEGSHETFGFETGNGENQTFSEPMDIKVNNLNDDNWVFSTPTVRNRLQEIENRGIPLSSIAKITTGLATLANSFYIFRSPLDVTPDIVKITLKDGREFEIERTILKRAVKASILKRSDEDQRLFIVFPYKKVKGKHVIIPEEELKKTYPRTYAYFSAVKQELDKRDKGKPNKVAWYAFGRTQGLDSTFGEKIITAPMNLKPNFIVRTSPDETFFDGYAIKYDGDLKRLAECLNSPLMETYIAHTSRSYGSNYKSYAKGFIKNFGVELK